VSCQNKAQPGESKDRFDRLLEPTFDVYARFLVGGTAERLQGQCERS
jgi:hypothetical protein